MNFIKKKEIQNQIKSHIFISLYENINNNSHYI